MIIASRKFASVQGTKEELMADLALLIHALIEKGVVSKRDVDYAVKLGKMDSDELDAEVNSIKQKKEEKMDEILSGLKDLAKVLEEVCDGE